MPYYKVRIEVWCDWDPAESDLEEISQSMGVGEAICTRREVVAVVNRPQDIEDEEAMSFFGGSEGDADENQIRKKPRSESGAYLRFLFGCVRNQAAIVPAFFCMISASARSQSSSS